MPSALSQTSGKKCVKLSITSNGQKNLSFKGRYFLIFWQQQNNTSPESYNPWCFLKKSHTRGNFNSFLNFTIVQTLGCCCCSVTKSRLTLRDPINCSVPGFPVLHYLLESAQIHVHWICDAIQTPHLLYICFSSEKYTDSNMY